MAEAFVEAVVRGPKGWDVGFLAGFLRGRGCVGPLLDGEAEGLDCESLRERFSEWFDPRWDTAHLFLRAPDLPLLREAVAAASGGEGPLELLHEAPVAGLTFTFSFVVYSRELGARLRGLLEGLPAGAALGPGGELREQVDPEAEGVELYAPAHAYQLEGRGSVAGEFLPVLEVLRALRAFEQVQWEKASVRRP